MLLCFFFFFLSDHVFGTIFTRIVGNKYEPKLQNVVGPRLRPGPCTSFFKQFMRRTVRFRGPIWSQFRIVFSPMKFKLSLLLEAFFCYRIQPFLQKSAQKYAQKQSGIPFIDLVSQFPNKSHILRTQNSFYHKAFSCFKK